MRIAWEQAGTWRIESESGEIIATKLAQIKSFVPVTFQTLQSGMGRAIVEGKLDVIDNVAYISMKDV